MTTTFSRRSIKCVRHSNPPSCSAGHLPKREDKIHYSFLQKGVQSLKRIILLVSMLFLLTGCSLVADEYTASRPHESGMQTNMPDAVVVKDPAALKEAILRFIKAGKEVGSIRTVDYVGNVEEDLVRAIYEATRMTPVGAYAVDYLNHNCVKILSYYEISLSITYRRSARDIAAIQQAYTPEQLRGQVERSLQTYDEHLAIQVTEDQEYDIEAIVKEYCLADPARMVEIPQVAISVFPETGSERIVAVDLRYENTYDQLLEKSDAVLKSVSAAAEYIRYRQTDREKTELLYTYLTERFRYTEGKTSAPVWSALCDGVSDPYGLAQAFRLICEKAGVECYTVTGLKDGEEYTWNIVSDDGDFRHVDLAVCIAQDSGLWRRTDWDMGRYYWNTQLYPACVTVSVDHAMEQEVVS